MTAIPPRRARRLATALPWFAGLFGAAVLGGAAVLLAQDLRRELAAAVDRAALLAAGTAEAVSHRLAGIDFALQGLAARIDPARLDDPAHRTALHQALVETRNLSRDTNAFVVLDRTGRLIATSRVPPERTEAAVLADRPLFAPIAADPRPDLHVSPPYHGLLGNVAGRAIIALGRPIFDAEGRFAGVVSAILPVFEGRGLLPVLPLPAATEVLLMRGDGVPLERRPAAGDALPPFTLPEAVAAAMRRSPTGRLTADTPEGTWLVAWHGADRGQAAAIVCVKHAAVVAAWAQLAVPVGLATLAGAALLVMLALRLGRTIGRLEEARAELEWHAKETSAIADALGIALWVRRRAQAPTEYRGSFAERLTGKPLALLEAEPNAWRKLVVHPEDREALKASYRGSDLSRGWRHEYRIIAADGSVRWVEDRAIQFKDETGDGPVYGAVTDITETHAMRERLARRERELADAVELAGLAFWRLPADADTYEWSAENYRQFGLDPETFVPQREAVAAMIVAEDRDRVAATLERVLTTGESVSYIYSFRRADGALRVRWSLARGERDAAGRIVAIAGVSEDITERYEMHLALTREQRRLAEAGRIAGIGFWRLARGSTLLEWTDEVYRQMGETRESFVPTLEALYERILPEDREATRAAAERVWATGEPESIVYRIRRPNGEVRFRWVSMAVERDAAGEAVAISGVSQDITEQRLATERLARQERLIAEAGRVAKIGFYRRDLATGAIECTPEFLAQHGLPAEARPDLAVLRALVHPEDLPALEADVARVIAQGETVTRIYRVRGTDGVLRWLRTTFGLERDADGRPAAISGLFQDVSEEQEAAARLAEQAEQLRRVERVAHIGFYRRALDGSVMVASPEKLRQFGLPADAGPLHVEVFRARFHPEDRPLIEAAGRRIVETGSTETAVVRVCHPDGTLRWIRIVAGLERDAEGRPLAVAGLSQDVTEEVEAAEKLRRQDRLLAAAGRVARLGFWSRRIDETTMTWSEEVFRHHGLAPGAITPTLEEMRARIHPEDRAAWEAARERLTRTGESQTVTVRVAQPDGTLRWIRIAAGIERGADGIPAVFGITQDVTEEVEAQARLDRQQRQLAEAGRIAGLGFWRLPLGGDRFELSPAIYDQLGLDPRTFGATVAEVLGLMPAEDRERVRATLDRVARTGEQASMTYRVRCPDGQVRHRSSSVGLERAADGTAVALVGVSVDITERVEQQERLERSQRLNALGELTGGIAHDVNNLLSVIGLNLELLRDLVPEGEAQALTEAALHAVEQGAKLARSLLAFAQRQALRAETVPLAPLLGALANLLGRTLGGRVVLAVEVDSATPPARADPAQLEAALVNLVLNARDAMPQGGRVTIRAAPASAEEAAAVGLAAVPHVRLSVADQGVGMPPEVLARAFEPFFTTKGAGKGTGLGLAMVYGFARQSGGEVRIESTEGVGTTVTLWLPAADEAPATSLPAAADRAVLAGARVLVVEDEAPLRILVERLCRDAGMAVATAADADAALDLLRAGAPIDLVLTDIRMPGRLDGHALAAAARALRPGLPVVLMTGYDDTATATDLPLLRKPFDRETLFAALAAGLAAARRAIAAE